MENLSQFAEASGSPEASKLCDSIDRRTICMYECGLAILIIGDLEKETFKTFHRTSALEFAMSLITPTIALQI
jgi:hypothetical protein